MQVFMVGDGFLCLGYEQKYGKYLTEINMAMGQQEPPSGPQVLGTCFLLPLVFFGYPAFCMFDP